jgi:hypothetical protein
MSHITTVAVEITDAEAFAEACKELGLNVKRDSEIVSYDGKRAKVLIAVTGNGEYGIGLVKKDGKFVLTGDFQCFGWGMPAAMKAKLKGSGDVAIQNLLKQVTTKHGILRLAAKNRNRVQVTENPDGTIKMTLTR